MPGIPNRIIIAVLPMLLQNLTGYVHFVFPPHVLVPSRFCSIVDLFDRRLPLLVGAVGAGIAMFYLTIYTQLRAPSTRSRRAKLAPEPPSAWCTLRDILWALLEQDSMDLRVEVAPAAFPDDQHDVCGLHGVAGAVYCSC
ncbi:hypothetical protein BJX68DRAFT_266605 [Aspergillus pseudodeflectus]|uniref:Uncharacterized protein n=1 Tax=Aspergillus pseudodeflectus TaxID=176178 RepID=A0ABR4KGQ3_9EURO